MKADGTKGKPKKKKKMHRKKKCAQIEKVKERKVRKQAVFYRIVNSTIYTASFKTQMSSTI